MEVQPDSHICKYIINNVVVFRGLNEFSLLQFRYVFLQARQQATFLKKPKLKINNL